MIKPIIISALSAVMLLTASHVNAEHHSDKANHHDAGSVKAAIHDAVNNNTFRTEQDKVRDQYRNPAQTLAFFGLQPNMTVAEVGPSSGWYTRILAPLIAQHGKYIGLNDAPSPGERYERSMQWRETFIDHQSGLFGANASARFMGETVPFAAPNSVDAVLVIRGMHGRIANGGAKALLDEVFTTLKPGGILGIVQHREPEASDTDPTTTMRGYVKQSYIIDLVTSHGFELEASSEVNANAKDTAQWERGVWALQAGRPMEEKTEQNREIGESDRMTLKFVKPLE